jgi:RNA polymerase sigma-70 factor (ECF subfamily)
VQHCLAGSPEAFGALYDRYFPSLYSYAWRLLGDQEAAEEAAHDTLTKAWSSLRAYQPGNFRAWLFSIAHNTIIDRRRANLAPVVSLSDDRQWAAPDSTERQAIDRAELGDVVRILSHFSDEQRSIVAMKLSGLRHAEIAAALGKTEGAVTQEYCRSIRKLADALERGLVPAAAAKGGGHDV